MKPKLLVIIAIVFLATILVLLILNEKRGRAKIEFMITESIETLEIPLYPGSQDVVYLSSAEKTFRQVTFKVKLPYPSKDVYQFYKNRLEEIGFESSSPESFSGINPIGEWALGYAKPDAQNPSHANLDAFWINKKERKFILLQLFYDWTDLDSKSTIKLDKNKSQNGVIWTTVLNDQIDISEIDVYDYLGKIIFKDDKKISEIERSELNGHYSFKKEAPLINLCKI